MQDDYYAAYRAWLRKGLRIEIGIPLSGGGVFRDWAIIVESRGDEILAQISRDVLPANVRVDVGFILDVSIWIKKDVYTCSGIVTEKYGGRVLRIRLFGDFTLRERRQFFRIDLNLRIRYALLKDPDKNDVELDWESRRDLEHMKFQGYDHFVIAAQQARFHPAVKFDWQEILRAELNLGGGGLCIHLPEPVQEERLLNLEIHLPLTPPRLIHAVAEVIYAKELKARVDGAANFAAGARFVFLDERDRDLIFQHISVTQIAVLRKKAEMRGMDDLDRDRGAQSVTWREMAPRVLWTLFFLILSFYLVRYFIHYQQTVPSGEIQSIYEKAIKKYRHEDK